MAEMLDPAEQAEKLAMMKEDMIQRMNRAFKNRWLQPSKRWDSTRFQARRDEKVQCLSNDGGSGKVGSTGADKVGRLVGCA